jgi:hypothetical protein
LQKNGQFDQNTYQGASQQTHSDQGFVSTKNQPNLKSACTGGALAGNLHADIRTGCYKGKVLLIAAMRTFRHSLLLTGERI